MVVEVLYSGPLIPIRGAVRDERCAGNEILDATRRSFARRHSAPSQTHVKSCFTNKNQDRVTSIYNALFSCKESQLRLLGGTLYGNAEECLIAFDRALCSQNAGKTVHAVRLALGY